jgi:Fe-S-cluster containining protein
MTIDELDQMYSELDEGIAAALKNSGDNPPCKRGCFFCCKEPVYATSKEVGAILALLTDDQKNDLRLRVSLWRDLFLSSGLDTQDECPVVPYRTLNAWCPLLNVDGTCSVYSRRPCACRLHVAKTSSIGCEKDDLRQHQIYIYFKEMAEQINFRLWDGMRDGERVAYDHLGILLYEALFNVRTPTKSRVEVKIKGDDMEVYINERHTRTN